MNMTYKRSRVAAALAMTVIVAVCVAGCGSSSSTSTSSSGSSSAAAAAAGTGGTANRAKLAACLKQHGVTLPSRPRSGGGYGPPPGAPSGSANGTTNSNGNGNGGSGNGNGNGSGSGNGNGLGNSGYHNGLHNGTGPGGGRFNNPKFRAALKACGATAGFRGRGNFRPSSVAITKFASCVKQHGYTLPKPNLTGKGPVYPVSIERNAKFQAASRSCQSMLRPAGGGAPRGGGAPPGA